jgi:hypothetical protein
MPPKQGKWGAKDYAPRGVKLPWSVKAGDPRLFGPSLGSFDMKESEILASESGDKGSDDNKLVTVAAVRQQVRHGL